MDVLSEIVKWGTATITVIHVAEKVYLATTYSKRKRQPVEVSEPYPGDRGDRRVLRVPWHCIRHDRKRGKYIIPNHGIAEITEQEYKAAKKSNSGWTMMDFRGAQDIESYYRMTGRYPL